MKTAANIISRNAPCWCGSGKKYKKCHLLIDQKEVSAFVEKPKPKRRDRSIIIKTEEQVDGIRKSSQMTKHQVSARALFKTFGHLMDWENGQIGI